jgi:hypothetical protein
MSPVPSTTSSSVTLEWIKKKLSDCTTIHECSKRTATTLPTRLLRLEATSPPTVRIVEPEAGGDEYYRATYGYVTLSHCWGGVRGLITTHANLNSMKKSIPFGDLPKTFQDAIHLTLQLGKKHLWIDSLCIIQDDRGDWHREASQMADVYRNSYLTLAATKSANNTLGCFIEESPLTKDYKLDRNLYVRKQISHWYDEPNTNFAYYPLLGRGWSFQERLLSPRIIHFTDREVIWECQKHTACQCSGSRSHTRPDYDMDKFGSEVLTISIPFLAQVRPTKDLLDPAQNSNPEQLKESQLDYARKLVEHLHANPETLKTVDFDIGWREGVDLAGFVRKWHNLVTKYSSLSLTFNSDSLPALSGLAEAMQPSSSWKYLAGLWDKTLVRDLLWCVPDVRLTADSASLAEQRNPSWSWASTDHAVSYTSLGPILCECQILDSECVPVSVNNPRGQVEYGFVKISSRLLETRIRYPDAQTKSSAHSEDCFVSIGTRNGFIRHPVKLDFDVSAPGPDQIPSGSSVYLLLIACAHQKCVSLVLRSVEKGSSGLLPGMDLPEHPKTFKRIGLLTVKLSAKRLYQSLIAPLVGSDLAQRLDNHLFFQQRVHGFVSAVDDQFAAAPDGIADFRLSSPELFFSPGAFKTVIII